MSERFLVIGGDAAGMSAASKAKRDDPELEVVVFERGDWVSYGACGLPYYVEGIIEHLDDLVIVDPDKVAQRGIDLRRGSEVVGITPRDRTITVESDDGRYEEPYDHLLLATGGRGKLPPVPGAALDGVFTIRNLDAGRALRNYIHPDESTTVPQEQAGYGSTLREMVGEVDTVAVLGANKIGLELAEAFVGRGLEVHVFETGATVLPVYGTDVASVVDQHLRERGVHLHLGTDVEQLRGDDGSVTAVETGDGSVDVGAVVADLGVDPNTELASDAGIELGTSGAVARDEYGRTNVPDVYAAGDCAEKHHLLLDETITWPYALAANRAGRAIGSTVAGTPTPVGGIVGTNVMKLFDLEVARTGLTRAEAEAAGFDAISRTITTITRAHYYGGWTRITVRMTADRDSGRLLGGSLVGEEGAAHRVNAVATALHARMTVAEVGSLDFGYAPPFGPVWDPVLTAAKVLEDARG